MFRKVLCLIIPLSLLFSGCTGTREIDKASIVETITVKLQEGEMEYGFYLISDSEKVKSISIKADSFQNACKSAQDKYIPNIVFDKINLILFDENLNKKSLINDINFITHQSDLSPLIYISVCDTDTLKRMEKEKDMPEQLRYHIDMLKKKENKVHIYSLSIFNYINSDKSSYLYITSIKSKDEITANSLKLLI